MNYFVVFDFETDGVNPETCQPVQLACIFIDPYNLEIVEGSEFCSYMKPIGIDTDDYLTDDVRKTVQWHSNNMNCSVEEVLEIWKNAPLQKNVWENFVQHINKYNPKKAQYSAPVAAGMNIRNFDLIIAKRLNEQYKVKKLFSYEVVDLRELFFYSLVWDTGLRSRSMDKMRDYFGLKHVNSHDALQDVKDEAIFVCRYLQFFKNTFNRQPNPYKGCMKTLR